MPELDPYLDEAEQSLAEGDPEGALEATDEALRLAPDLVSAWHLRGLALLDLGDVEEGRAAVSRALDLDAGYAPAAWSLADLLLWQDGEPGRTVSICDTYLRQDLEDELYADFLNLKAAALCELGDFSAALPVYERAGALSPDQEDPGGIGWCHYELSDFGRAEAALDAAVKGPGRDNPATHYYLAVTLARNGREKAARKHFRIAARLDPDHWFVPVHVPDEEFARLVETAVEGLSDELKGRLDNIDVVVEPWPAPDHLRGTDLSPSIVGMFRGTSLRHRSTFDPQADFPREIVVYQRNLEHSCRTRAEMVEQIRITLWHEIGHFLGLSEEDLGERGLD